jgi:hypothetical protein
VPAGEQADEDAVDHRLLAHDDLPTSADSFSTNATAAEPAR